MGFTSCVPHPLKHIALVFSLVDSHHYSVLPQLVELAEAQLVEPVNEADHYKCSHEL
jgi:hypothetical protein